MMNQQMKVAALAVLSIAFASSAFAQDAALIKDADNPARQPWAQSRSAWIGNVPAPGTQKDFVVPANERLVIENYSFGWGASCAAPLAVVPEVILQVKTGGETGNHFLKLDKHETLIEGNVRNRWGGNGLLRLYADPGSSVWYVLGGTTYPISCRLALSGYLVDAP